MPRAKSSPKQKVETTGDAAALATHAEPFDASMPMARTSACSPFPRRTRRVASVPVAQNMIHFELSGAGKILGVGNGDPSCHEPDTFMPKTPVRSVAGQRLALETGYAFREGRNRVRNSRQDFDDSSWKTIKAKTDGDLANGVERSKPT